MFELKIMTSNFKSENLRVMSDRRKSFLDRIKPFNPYCMTPTMTCALFATRGSGKSVLVKELMCYKMKNYDMCIVCCPSSDARETYGDIVGNEFIYDDEDQIIQCIKNVVQKQQFYTKIKKALRVLLVLDDVGYDDKIKKLKEFKKLFMNGRHLEIGLMAIYQYPKAIEPSLRRNLDYVMFLSQQPKDILGIHEDMFKGSCSFEELKWLMENVTANRGVFIVKQEKVNLTKSDALKNEIMDRLYHYTADLHLPNFQIGSRGIWKMHYMFGRLPSYRYKPKNIGLWDDKNKKNKIDDAIQESEYTDQEERRLEDIERLQDFKSRGVIETVKERPLDIQNQKKMNSLVRSIDDIDNHSYKKDMSCLGSSVTQIMRNVNFDKQNQ